MIIKQHICHVCVYRVECSSVSHPAGLSALPDSAHLKVTFLAQTTEPPRPAGLPMTMGAVADGLLRCRSSSINKSRKESEEVVDCSVAALRKGMDKILTVTGQSNAEGRIKHIQLIHTKSLQALLEQLKGVI